MWARTPHDQNESSLIRSHCKVDRNELTESHGNPWNHEHDEFHDDCQWHMTWERQRGEGTALLWMKRPIKKQLNMMTHRNREVWRRRIAWPLWSFQKKWTLRPNVRKQQEGITQTNNCANQRKHKNTDLKFCQRGTGRQPASFFFIGLWKWMREKKCMRDTSSCSVRSGIIVLSSTSSWWRRPLPSQMREKSFDRKVRLQVDGSWTCAACATFQHFDVEWWR